MLAAESEFLRSYLKKNSGLALEVGKEYLLESRLQDVLKQFSLTHFGQLINELKIGRNYLLRDAVIEAMTTNESYFFRDAIPFQELQSLILPDLIQQNADSRQLRIWSAASSTGQEPYSLAIHCDEQMELQNWDVQITATDIDRTVLKRAEEGVFTKMEVARGLTINQIKHYFDSTENGYRVSDKIRSRLSWRPLNLLDYFPQIGQFDLIFVRNVLIYFDLPTKQDVVARMHKVLKPGGYLFLGAGESLFGLDKKFTRVTECKSAVYKSIGSAVGSS